MPARRRKRQRAPSPEEAACRWCGQSYDQTVCAVDWAEVWKQFAVAQKEATLGRPLTDAERDAVSHGSDPCDDCCCGACGQRKRNGVVCC